MRTPVILILLCLSLFYMACNPVEKLNVEVYETSASGNKLQKLEQFEANANKSTIVLNSFISYQEILGFGGSFTEASAYLLNQLGEENRQQLLEAYFGDEGAQYSLTRTHINSSDFSLGNYSYAPVADDMQLENFSIEEDRDDIIPMIKAAQEISSEGFEIISSPWTAPPWMKDNNDWKGGKLLPKYYDTWALYFSKYIQAYKNEGIDIWGITVENEPLGNDSNWESMHYTPEEMNEFVANHLGPQLKKDAPELKILGYDQNRDVEMREWVDAMYGDSEAAPYFDGIAIHWYGSTYDVFEEALQYAHEVAPDRLIIQTEACVDAQVPVWKDDAWYWSKEATDWGWDWAPEDRKHLHPKYAPVYRYARDIIGCMNNWVNGWVDWNMILDRQGGPNWANNWCIAPVIVDPEQDEVYYTPLFYTMAHFSKYIRPGAKRIGLESSDKELLATAAQNPDGSIAVVILNQTETAKSFTLQLNDAQSEISISPKAIQTLVIAQ